GGTLHTIGPINHDGTTTPAEVEAAFDAVLGANKVNVSGSNWTSPCSGWGCSNPDQDMTFTFAGYNVDVNQLTVYQETYDGSFSVTTTNNGGPRAMGTSPISGGNNYCYGATDGTWTVNSATAIAANGSA